MKITKQQAIDLLELSIGDNTIDWENFDLNFKLVHTDQIDSRRWVSVHEAVYQDLNTLKYYWSTYEMGLTECQDTSPYEYVKDEIELIEVEPKEVTTTIYVRKDK